MKTVNYPNRHKALASKKQSCFSVRCPECSAVAGTPCVENHRVVRTHLVRRKHGKALARGVPVGIAVLPDGSRLSYLAYLASDAWSVFRLAYASRCGWSCYVCGVEHGLDLHHKTYRRLGSEYLRDVVALCRKHHVEVHDAVANGRKLYTAHHFVKGNRVGT